MSLVSNASPLIFLAKIDVLDLLQGCFSQILVSPTVAHDTRMTLPRFIEQRPLSQFGEAFVSGAIGTLHRGELEALVLAREQGIDLVALDDAAARRRATRMGLQPIGTLGLLVMLRRLGHLDPATAARKLDDLINHHGIYLSAALRAQACRTLLNTASDPDADPVRHH